MQRPPHSFPLPSSFFDPFPGAGPIGASRKSAGPGCCPVQDRPIDLRVDNVVFRHARPLLYVRNLTPADQNGYGAKTENVQ
jgi:hypothetical protein